MNHGSLRSNRICRGVSIAIKRLSSMRHPASSLRRQLRITLLAESFLENNPKSCYVNRVRPLCHSYGTFRATTVLLRPRSPQAPACTGIERIAGDGFHFISPKEVFMTRFLAVLAVLGALAWCSNSAQADHCRGGYGGYGYGGYGYGGYSRSSFRPYYRPSIPIFRHRHGHHGHRHGGRLSFGLFF